MDKQKKLILIDIFGLIYKFFFTMPRMTAPGGTPTNAVYGLARVLLKLARESDADFIVPALESKSETFRHKLFPDYKAHREKMPDALVVQIPIVVELLEALGLPAAQAEGFEADDIIGTLSRRAAAQGYDVDIITGDKDMLQLVDDRVTVLMTQKGISDLEPFDREKVKQLLGVFPEHVVDLKGLAGDKSDNIPGIPGVGDKTAVSLLDKFESIDNIYAGIENVSNEKLRQKLEDNRELALLSLQLATIVRDAPIDVTLENFQFKGSKDNATLAAFLNKYSFKSLIRDLNLEKVLEKTAPLQDNIEYSSSCNIIFDESELEAFVNEIKKAGRLCIDLETTGLDSIQDSIVGISISVVPGCSYYVPVGHTIPQKVTQSLDIFNQAQDEQLTDEDKNNHEMVMRQIPRQKALDILRPVLEDSNIGKLGHNLKFDWLFLRSAGVKTQGIAFDSMLASYLLEPASSGHSLKTLAGHLLGSHFKTYQDMVGKGKNQICFSDVPISAATDYACRDVDLVLRIEETLRNRLADKNVMSVFENLEMPLVQVLGEMEFTGVCVDSAFLKELSLSITEKERDILAQVRKISGLEINLNSPKQVAELLFDKLGLQDVKKRSTDIHVLEELQYTHEIVPMIINYRQLSKLRGTYIDALPSLVKPATGRIHTSFNQHIAATGRLSSSDPNLQNIPIRSDEGREIRKAFVPGGAGLSLLTADYSQVEIRLLAHFSKDPSLIQAFVNGEDIHTRTAADVFGVPLDAVTKNQRRYAKTINFGLIYGMREFRLSQALGISRQEAATFIDNYFSRFPGVREFIEETRRNVLRDGYVTTLFGRRRDIPEIGSSNKNEQQAGLRAAFNTILQGTAADIMKLAMIRVFQKIESGALPAKMIIQVHDELVFEAPDEKLNLCASIVRDIMENCTSEYYQLAVPLTVDVSVGPNWLDIKPFKQ